LNPDLRGETPKTRRLNQDITPHNQTHAEVLCGGNQLRVFQHYV